MTIPILRDFTKQYPNVKLTVLTRSFFKPFFRDLNNVTVYCADVKEKHKGVLGLWKLSRELKKLEIDAIADLHNVLRSKALKFFFFGTKCIQIDKGRSEKKALTSGQSFEQLKTTHQRYADVFKTLGFKIDLSNPSFPKPCLIDDFSPDLIKQNIWIGIAPFAAFKSKAYPLDAMEKVIANLSKTNKIVLFGGGPSEIEKLNAIEDKYEQVINLAGKLTLDQELDVISNLDVMVSMDSGNAHIAAMLGIKVVTIWGVTHPYAGFNPFNQNAEHALLVDRNQFPKISTSVYGNRFPEDYENAIDSIRPKTIIDKINSILDKN